MIIEVLGSGCPKCKKLEQNTVEAVNSIGIRAEIKKVTDIDTIFEKGVVMTPALVVDGIVKSSGKLLTPDQICELLKKG